METNGSELKTSGRPVRNLKPVSYKEVSAPKRSPTNDKAAKDSEPKDKKKKKANGNGNVDEPAKKSVKKKASDPVDEPTDQNGDDADELMPESRNQADVPKPAAEKAKKTQSRKKKTDEDSDNADVEDAVDKKAQKGPKPPIRRKGKDAVEPAAANGEGASKTEAVPSKPTKGKKTNPSATDVQTDATVEPATNGAGSSKSEKAPAKTGKGKKNTPAAAEVDIDAVEEATNGAGSSKSEKASSKAGKGKKVVAPVAEVKTDSHDSEDEAPIEPVAPKPSKSSRGKKAGDSEGPIDSQEKPVASKAVAAKNSRAKKADKAESNGKSDGQDEVAVPAKPAKSAKGKKAVPQDAAEENEDTEASAKANKGRSKKPTAKDQPIAKSKTRGKAAEPLASASRPTTITTLRGKRRKSEDLTQNAVSKPKQSRTTSTSESQSIAAVDLQSPTADWNTKICTWNVAGLRAVVKKNGLDYLVADNADIICLQETKCMEDEVPEEIKHVKGYHKYWRGEKGGKAGVALLSKVMPYDVKFGFNDPEFDAEARLITAEYTKYYLVCVYVPNAGRNLVNLDRRMVWDAKFQDYLESLNQKKPVIICGDMNVAHEEIDLANPKTNMKSAGFTLEERNSFTNLLSKGFVDTFRQLYPDKSAAYTFWTYLRNARARNVGWRLDYFIVSERLMTNVVDNIIRSTIPGSDHCPVSLFLKF